MRSSSHNDLVKSADDLGNYEKFWGGKLKFLVIKAISKCFDADDIGEKKKTLDLTIRSLKQLVTIGPLRGTSETPSPSAESLNFAALINNPEFRRELKMKG